MDDDHEPLLGRQLEEMNKSPSATTAAEARGGHSGLSSLRVLYDFKYVSPEGKDIAIKQGEKLTLLDKTDADWWKVRRFKTPFYVPANYVTEIVAPSGHGVGGDGMNVWESAMRSRDIAEWTSGSLLGLGAASAAWQLRMSASWSALDGNGSPADDQARHWLPPAEDVVEGSARRTATAAGSDPPAELTNGHHAAEAAIDGHRARGRTSVLRKRPVSARIEKAGRLSLASFSVGTRGSYAASVDTGTPAMSVDAPASRRHAINGGRDSEVGSAEVGCWPDAGATILPPGRTAASIPGSRHSAHVDAASLRLRVKTSPAGAEAGYSSFSVHTAADAQSAASPHAFSKWGDSGQKGSSPPLSMSAGNGGSVSLELAGSQKLVKKHSLQQSTLKGWTETVDYRGQKAFVHTTTGDRWLAAEDSTGRPYYYRENTDHTVWELPEATAAVARLRLLQVNEVLKQDVMQTCRVPESGRKNSKRNWEQSCVMATATHLHIYKEERTTPKKAAEETLDTSQPDAVLSLDTAKVSWMNQKLSKKNVLEVAFDNGCYLLQHDDLLLMREWYTLLHGGRSPTTQMPVSPSQEMRDSSTRDASGLLDSGPDDSRLDDQSKDGIWRTKGTRFKRGGVYNLNGPNVQNGPNMAGVREKLKGLLARRPAMKDLEAKGIIRENIFNTHLLFLCNREQTTVPKFVERCISAIETMGLDAEGLYRVTPSSSEVQALRNQIDSDDMYTLSNWDIHVLAGALKMFFRELQEPLIPFDYYKMFIDALGIGDSTQQLSTYKLLISMMLPATRDTLHTLMAHLLRVSEHCSKNKMTVENIAKVFGQTLMRPEEDSSSAASLSSAHCHNAVIEYILTNYARIF